MVLVKVPKLCPTMNCVFWVAFVTKEIKAPLIFPIGQLPCGQTAVPLSQKSINGKKTSPSFVDIWHHANTHCDVMWQLVKCPAPRIFDCFPNIVLFKRIRLFETWLESELLSFKIILLMKSPYLMKDNSRWKMGMQNLLPGSKKRERGLGISFVRMRNYIALFNSHGACFKNVEPVVTAQENISI